MNSQGTLKQILEYGGSTFAALIAASVYTITDEFFIGHAMGIEGLSIMGLAFPVTILAIALNTIAGIGSSAVVSESIGRDETGRSEALMRSNFLYMPILGTLAAAAVILAVDPILATLPGSDSGARIADQAATYLKIYFLGTPFMLIFTLAQTFMRCIDHPRHVFRALAATSGTNIALDALMIFGLGLGVAGAAAATVLTQIVGALISAWYFTRSKQKFTTPRSFCGPGILVQEFQISFGFALAEIMIFPVGIYLNSVLLSHGASHLLAAASIISAVLSIVYLPLTGLDTGVQPLVSRLYAAGEMPQLKNVIKTSCFVTMAMSVLMYLIIIGFTKEIAEFFVAEDISLSDDMLAFIRYGFLLYPFVGIYTWICGVMAALEDTWRNLLLGILAPVIQAASIYMLSVTCPIEMVSLYYSAMDLIIGVLSLALAIPFLRQHSLPLGEVFRS